MSNLETKSDREKFVENVRLQIQIQQRKFADKWKELIEYGGEAVMPTRQIIDEALQFAEIVFQHTLFVPTVHLGFNGKISFIWDVNRVWIDTGFCGDGTYSYFSAIDSGQDRYSSNIPVNIIPDELIDRFNQFFEVSVATLTFDEEMNNQEKDTVKKWQFDTVFVNKRGQIIRTEQCEAYYYDEIQNPKSKIRMIYIPEGEFWMGSPESEKDRYEDENSQHKVTVSSFFMSQTAITEAQWRFVADLRQEQQKLNPNPANKGENHPVVNISWQDAMEFCARLSRYTGRNYRLPSEAEWEYACRAVISEGSSLAEWNEKYNQPFHFGETITSELANYDSSVFYQEEDEGKYRKKTIPVGQFPPNAFGLYDMHGNVWEWCLDPWHDNYIGAPNEGRVWDEKKDELDDRSYVLRGGSWSGNPWNCRSASRYFNGGRFNGSGFRVVCVPPNE